MELNDIIEQSKHPIADIQFQKKCHSILKNNGVLTLPDFLTDNALKTLLKEAQDGMKDAYYCQNKHTVYLQSISTDDDTTEKSNHPRHRHVISSKGCICDDQIASNSILRQLYNSTIFRNFIIAVTATVTVTANNNNNTSTEEQNFLYPYKDKLSSINIHYAQRGQELGWHFDNSDFAITLLIQKPKRGGQFEYVKDIRRSNWKEDEEKEKDDDKTIQQITQLLDGVIKPKLLDMYPGTLVLFRGRNSIHRVSPNESDTVRILAVLAYNSKPNIALSENARMTFYGRLY